MTGLVAQLLDILTRSTRLARLRSQIAHHTDLLAKLPESSRARKMLGEHVDRLTEVLVAAERDRLERRHDYGAAIVALILAAGAGYAAWAAFNAGSWWWFAFPICALFALTGLVGLFTELSGRPAAARGEADA